MNEDVMRELGRRCPEQKIATLEVDAALWAEMNVVVADEFRDGNVHGFRQRLKGPLRNR